MSTAKTDNTSSSSLLSAIHDAAPYGIALVQLPEGTLVSVNDAFLRLFELTREAALGRTSREIGLTSPDQYLRVGEELRLRGRVRDFEVTRRTQTGATIVLSLNVDRVTIEGRDFTLTTIIDLTERKRLERKLGESEERKAFLLHLSDTLRPLADTDAILRETARLVGEHLRVTRVHYARLLGDQTLITCAHAAGAPPLAGDVAVAEFHSRAAVLRPGGSVAIDDVATDLRLDEETRAAFLAREIGATLSVAVPFAKDGSGRANLIVDSKTPRAWTEHEIALLRDTAERTRDAVRRARAEAALRESEATLRAIAETVPSFLFMSDAQARPIFENRAWLEFTGTTHEDLVTRGWESFYHPEDLRTLRSLWMEASARGKAVAYETRVKRHDGAYRWFSGRLTPMKDAAGRTATWVGAMTDIHERRQAEQALRESEARQRFQADLLANAAEAMAATDEHLVITYWNRAAEELFGWTAEEVLGQPSARIFRTEVPDPTTEAAMAAMLTEGRFRGEVGYRHKDGTPVPTEVHSAVLRGPNGELRGTVTAFRDVIARKKVEELHAFQSAVLASVFDPLWATDSGFRIMYWNEAAAATFGWTADEVQGRHAGELFRTRVPGSTRDAAIAQLLRTGSFGAEVVCQCKDGRRLLVEVSSRVVRGPDGEVVRVVNTARDVTARKRLEDEKERLQQELRVDLDAMTRLQRIDALFLKEKDIGPVLSEIVEAAIAMTEADFGVIQLLDATTGELKIAASRGFEDWYVEFWDGGSEPRGCCGAAFERRARVVVEDVETSRLFAGTPGLDVQRRAGVRAVQSTPLLSSSGRPLGMLSTHIRRPGRPSDRALRWVDVLAREVAAILERHEAEDALRKGEAELRLAQAKASGILSVSADALVTIDQDHRITMFNDGAERIFQWSKAEALGARLEILIPARFRARHARLVEEFASSHVPARRMEGRDIMGLRKSGEEFPADASISKLEVGGETILTVALRDMSKQRQMEEQLRGAVSARERILGVVAHDLRNPLGTILMQTALLQLSREQPQRGSAGVIERAATRMNRIINDLLDVTRIDAGQLAMDRAAVSAGDLLAEIAVAHTPRITAKSLAFVLPAAEDLAALPALWADKERLLQIFDNLLGNSTRFTQRGSISIGAKFEGDAVVFSVSDTGSGIAPEDAEHVFERFWQAKEAARSGAGLGLSIVKGLVESHGGRVWVESRLGAGSTFFFTVPVAAKAESVAEAIPAAKPSRPEQRPMVLVAEDDGDLREGLVKLLEEQGYQVAAVANGQEALERLRREVLPALLVFDLEMPVLDGWGLLAERERDPHLKRIPAVVVSGRQGVAARVHAANASFLPKPFPSGALIRAVEELARGSQDVDERAP